MVVAPDASCDQFSDLVVYVHGERTAAKLLGVRLSELRDWIERRQVPTWAGRLLWFYTAAGRHAMAEDLATELRYAIGERDSLRAEVDRKHRLIDEARASLAARVRALEQENDELRQLLRADTLTQQLIEASTVLNKLLCTLQVNERKDLAA